LRSAVVKASFATMTDIRGEVVAAAESQIGLSEPEPYWLACNVERPFPPAWCGAFALWSLKRAGLACAWDWQIGRGFLWRLTLTSSPQIGDIAYFAKHQHHAVVSAFLIPSRQPFAGHVSTVETNEYYAKTDPPSHVELVNGNGKDGRVTQTVTPTRYVTAFYSIDRLLTPSELPSV